MTVVPGQPADVPPPTLDPDAFVCLTVRWEAGRPVFDLGGWDDWAAVAVLHAVADEIQAGLVPPAMDGTSDDLDGADDDDDDPDGLV